MAPAIQEKMHVQYSVRIPDTTGLSPPQQKPKGACSARRGNEVVCSGRHRGHSPQATSITEGMVFFFLGGGG